MSHHVLVVDDDPGIRDIVEAILNEEGFSVATAANGREALDHITEDRPALVLLDLQMPVMTGWELLTHLRDARVQVPIVFMTAGFRAKTEAERHQVDGYIGKPFALDELVAVVERFASAGAS